jgi:cytoskeletal protein RodZ
MYLVSERGALLEVPDKRQNFWTTIPGILTGAAALLTAGTGLFLAINHTQDAASPASHSAQAPVSGSVSPSSARPASSADTSAPAPTTTGSVKLTSRTGEVTYLSHKTFRHSSQGKSIEFTSGQTIPFERIKSIDFQTVSNNEVAVNVTLTDGRVIAGSMSTNNLFQGDSDIGPFNIYMPDVKQVVLP